MKTTKSKHTIGIDLSDRTCVVCVLDVLGEVVESEKIKLERCELKVLARKHPGRQMITKAGDRYLRRLLVSAAQYLLGFFGKDCALRRFGLKLCERGGPRAKKKAVLAVARKLAVLMASLWKSGADYDPQRGCEELAANV